MDGYVEGRGERKEGLRKEVGRWVKQREKGRHPLHLSYTYVLAGFVQGHELFGEGPDGGVVGGFRVEEAEELHARVVEEPVDCGDGDFPFVGW